MAHWFAGSLVLALSLSAFWIWLSGSPVSGSGLALRLSNSLIVALWCSGSLVLLAVWFSGSGSLVSWLWCLALWHSGSQALWLSRFGCLDPWFWL